MFEIDFNIRTAVMSDRSRLANLIHFGSYIHQHLDWKSPLDWIGSEPYLILERESGFGAVLACPPEMPAVTWIRLFAVKPNLKVDWAWKSLWEAARDELESRGKIQVTALSLQSWFSTLLEESNFTHIDNVVVLMRENTHEIPTPISRSIIIRTMVAEDLAAVETVDNSAFELEWRNSIDSLEIGFTQSSIATVAEKDDVIIGYQYSTVGNMGGHLARLAVLPAEQSQGIGSLLVTDVLQQFRRLGVMHVTVNTQQNNHVSLSLYEKFGFYTTGESYRVYKYAL